MSGGGAPEPLRATAQVRWPGIIPFRGSGTALLTPDAASCIVISAMQISAQHHGHHHHGVRPCPRRLE